MRLNRMDDSSYCLQTFFPYVEELTCLSHSDERKLVSYTNERKLLGYADEQVLLVYVDGRTKYYTPMNNIYGYWGFLSRQELY